MKRGGPPSAPVYNWQRAAMSHSYYMVRSFDHAGYYETRLILTMLAMWAALYFLRRKHDPRYLIVFLSGVFWQAGMELTLGLLGGRGTHYQLSVFGAVLSGWPANVFQGCAEGGLLALMSFWYLDLRGLPDRRMVRAYLAMCALILVLATLVGWLSAGRPITSPRPIFTGTAAIWLGGTVGIALLLTAWKKAFRELGYYYAGSIIYVLLTFEPLHLTGARYIATHEATGAFTPAPLPAQAGVMMYSHLIEVAGGKIHYFVVPFALGWLAWRKPPRWRRQS